MGFDEPLVWPELPAWDGPAVDSSAAAGRTRSDGAPELSLPEVAADLDAELDFLQIPDPPAGSDVSSLPDLGDWWEPVDAGTSAGVPASAHPAGVDDPDAPAVNPSDPLGGLGGGAGLSVAPPAGGELPASIWADDPGTDAGAAVLVTSSMAGAARSTGTRSHRAVYAETEGAGGSRRRRSGGRGGNIAIVALISLASLVLLGMFLSVRGRDKVVPTDVSQQRPTADEIAVTGPLNTVPFTPTTSPPGSIDIAGLVPAPLTTDTTSSPATTATTRTTVAVTQPTTASTAAPVVTTTATTKPDDPQTSTTLRRTTTSFVFPSFPSSTVASNTSTSVTRPTVRAIP